MSLMVFLAICILGVDVLIYFLYEWAFGESERIRKRHPRCRFERFPVEISAATKPRSDANRAASTVSSTPLPSVPTPRSASLIVASPRPTPRQAPRLMRSTRPCWRRASCELFFRKDARLLQARPKKPRNREGAFCRFCRQRDCIHRSRRVSCTDPGSIENLSTITSLHGQEKDYIAHKPPISPPRPLRGRSASTNGLGMAGQS